jgi:precorrin-2 dehydrogenase / sirohydrochlorin ferrochelatase
MAIDADLYPVGLIIAGRPCLVVGGGQVAARKIAGLLTCGAAVTVVAPEAHLALGILARDGVFDRLRGPHLTVHLRPYEPGEAAGYRLVVTATGDPQVDASVFRDAEDAGVWVNSADDPDHCTLVLPAVTRDGPVTVAVSTGGSSPALASWLRSRIADALGPGLGSLASLLDDARQRIHARGATTETVDWSALLDGPLPRLVREGNLDEARLLIDSAVETAVETAPPVSSEPD